MAESFWLWTFGTLVHLAWPAIANDGIAAAAFAIVEIYWAEFHASSHMSQGMEFFQQNTKRGAPKIGAPRLMTLLVTTLQQDLPTASYEAD